MQKMPIQNTKRKLEEDKPDNTKYTDAIKKAQDKVKNATKGTPEHDSALDALKTGKR